MPDTKEVERPLTAEEKAEVQAYQAKKAREEELEKMAKKTEKPRSADDLLEAAYEKLSVIDGSLKTEIEAYFQDNGRWEKPDPDAVEPSNALADEEARKEALEKEEKAKTPAPVAAKPAEVKK